MSRGKFQNQNRKDSRNKGRQVKNNECNPTKMKEDTKDVDKALKPKKGSNDPKWYSVYPELVRDAANIPFSWSTGTPLNLQGSSMFGLKQVVPGVCAVTVYPSIGYAKEVTDPINVAANSMYSFVRHANSGSANYDSPDLMLYVLAMSQVYSAITWCERIYGCATLYSQRNRYMPRGLMAIQGVDFDSVNQNLASFRYGINVLINKAASFSVPKSMPIFERHAFLFQNIYSEGSSPKDQMYLYRPGGFYQYNEPTGSHPTGFLNMLDLTQNYEPTSGKLLEYVDCLNIVQNLLDSLIYSEDINIMSGDILKAYGAENCIKLATLPEVYPLVPIVNQVVLEQMSNATLVYGYVPGDIYQNVDQNVIVADATYDVKTTDTTLTTSSEGYVCGDFLRRNKILNTRFAEVNPDLIMELTRLMVYSDEVTFENGYYTAPLHFGTEIATKCVIYTFNLQSTNPVPFDYTSYASAFTYTSDASSSSLINRLCKVHSFDYAPQMTYIYLNGTTVEECSDFVDYNNYAVITHADLDRMHEAALLSELAVPIVNRV